MIRVLTIIAAVAALAVSAAPASAAPPRHPARASGRVGGKMHLDDVSMGVITDKKEGWWQRSR